MTKMTSVEQQTERAFQILKTIEDRDLSRGERKKSLLELGIKDEGVISLLLKMKRGVLTTRVFSFESEDPTVPAELRLRLLSSHEIISIENEISELKLKSTNSVALIYIAKTISRASKKISINMEQELPSLSEEAILNGFTASVLFDLGDRYKEFVETYSAKLETITKEQIDEVINALEEVSEDKEKKLDLLSGLSLNQTREILIDTVMRLTTLIKQVDKSFTG